MNKILKELTDFPYQYISEDGNLVSFRFNKIYEPAPFFDRDGYKRFMVYDKKGKRRAMAAHRLVYSAWVGKLINGLTIDHKDNQKLNNHFSNLAQMTFSENSKKENTGKCNPRKNRKLSKEQIINIFKMREQGVSFNEISKRIGMSPAMSWHILKGKTYYDISKGTY